MSECSTATYNVDDGQAISDDKLVEMRDKLQIPTHTIIGYTETLRAYAGQHETWADFMPDIDKILSAAKQLSELITRTFDKSTYANGKIDIKAFGSTVRHDLRTPINAILGYSEMILEDLIADEEQFAYDDLKKILSYARKLLNLIDELGAISNANLANNNESTAPNKKLNQDILHIGEQLQSTINEVIDIQTELHAEIQTQPSLQSLSDDVNKIARAGNNLANQINMLFSTNNQNNAIDPDDFSSTVRHDLRTPINALIGFSELLLEELADDPNQHLSAQQKLAKISNLSASLLTMIDSLGLIKKGHNNSNTVNKIDSATELDITSKKLLAIIKQIKLHIQSLLQHAKIEEHCRNFIPDLNNMLEFNQQTADLTEKLFIHNPGKNEIKLAERYELLAPINAIIGFAEMLLEDLDRNAHCAACDDLEQLLSLEHKILNIINTLKVEADANISASLENNLAETNNDSIIDTLISSPSAELNPEHTTNEKYYILVVDDKDSNRDLLSRRLSKQGLVVDTAADGIEALNKISTREYDLILLDVIMPKLDGFQVLARIKNNEKYKHIPVLMISALDEIDGVVRCITMGAEDFIQKPFNQIILNAKISASLERKRLRDREHAFMQRLQAEQEKSEKLLLNVLPKAIADRLKHGTRTIADSFPEATVLFSDLVGFTELSTDISAATLVDKLNDIFSAFDILTGLYQLEKIKTIGDAYMLVGGLPTPRTDHVEAVAEIAIDMFEAIRLLNLQHAENFQIRVGMHTGPVVAGVIGKNKFNYDLWGETVNIASRMESHGVPGKIQVSEEVYKRIRDKFIFEYRGPVEIKGKGTMITYFLIDRK
jgi:adenylate cyclase